MKDFLPLLFVFLLSPFTTVGAQTHTVDGKVSFGQRFSRATCRMKERTARLGSRIDDAFESVDSSHDFIRVRGVDYMPLYSVNLYNGPEADQFRLECQRAFAARYPRTVITSSVLPQREWIVTPVKQNKQVVGFLYTMLCHVIACDQDGGYYLNAQYAFRRYKEIGADIVDVEESWPQWERTDVMTKEVYGKILTKM